MIGRPQFPQITVIGDTANEASKLHRARHSAPPGPQARVRPLMYRALGDAVAIVAPTGGAPANPDWYHNLRANPQTKGELGGETYDVTARVAEGAERDEIWTHETEEYPFFAEYEE